MRELHQLEQQQDAVRLAGWLSRNSMRVRVEQEDGRWVLWLVDDGQKEAAVVLVQQFLSDPQAAQISESEVEGRRLLQQQNAPEARLNTAASRRLKQRWSGVWYYSFPATAILIGISLFVVAITTDWRASFQQGGLFMPTCNDQQSRLLSKLFIQTPPEEYTAIELLLVDPFLPNPAGVIRRGEIWRFVTPIFLHFGVLHILFNMQWLWGLGRWIEFNRGTGRYLLLVLMTAVIPNLAQLYWSGPNFGGMSGVVFGLIGYAWMKGRTSPEDGIGLPQDQIVYSIFFLLICMTGSLGPIANAAHLGGFLTGIVLGLRKKLWRTLLRR
ncbi:MAG: rhomboid family intramembrane serine protease [Planctomycetaceae bacterium]